MTAPRSRHGFALPVRPTPPADPQPAGPAAEDDPWQQIFGTSPTPVAAPVTSQPVEAALPSRRALLQRSKAGRRPDVAFDEHGWMVIPPESGHLHRRKPRRQKRSNWYAPRTSPAPSTTHQAEILNTAVVAAPTGPEGILIGRDRMSSTPVANDPFAAYEQKIITSPNVLILGVVGAGKSSLIKTVYVLRPLILRNRRAVVMDKKDRGGEGEYAETCRQLGGEPLRFVLGEGGTCLNILDPLIVAGSEDGASGQARLLVALAELANDGVPLEKWEKAALRAAHRAALREAEVSGRVPVLHDLLRHLTGLHPEFADYSPAAKERIHQAGLGVHHLLSSLLADELAGMFDGPTSPHVRLNDRLTVFDLSQLPDEGPAASMVMTVANVWLMGVLRSQRGLRTNFIAEEGWSLVGGPAGRVLLRNARLARGLGLCNVAALHHLADIPEGDPAITMIKDAQTVHLFRQDRTDDIDAVVRTFGLEPGTADLLANLDNGHHLLKIGNRREVHVEHVRSALEIGITDTDEAMRGEGVA